MIRHANKNCAVLSSEDWNENLVFSVFAQTVEVEHIGNGLIYMVVVDGRKLTNTFTLETPNWNQNLEMSIKQCSRGLREAASVEDNVFGVSRRKFIHSLTDSLCPILAILSSNIILSMFVQNSNINGISHF